MLERAPSRKASRRRTKLTNDLLAEVLLQQAAQNTGHLQKAYQRAALNAFVWPAEASDLIQQGRSLKDLAGIGPVLAKQVEEWIASPPLIPEIPPERRDFLTAASARIILDADPAWSSRYRGDLHMHSNWSDGSATIGEMAQAAIQRGYDYIALADHSQGLKIAGGITEAELIEQKREVQLINETIAGHGSSFRVLHCLEMNLNPRGEGDMSTEALARLDLVVGSFHSALRSAEDQTARYLAALRNPGIQILGHPRGRVYNRRVGLKADWRKVFAEAARLNKAVEIDAYPDRQDLNIELLKIARQEGCRISIDSDAHNPNQLSFVPLGLASALAAGIPAERVINFLSLPKLMTWILSVKQ